jgi:hypothetical protein
LLAASFSEAVVLLHVRGRKLGRFVYLPRTDRWMVVPLPDPRLERPIGVLVEVVLIDEQEQRCG